MGRINLAGNIFFNSYSNRFSKRSKNTTTTTTTTTYPCLYEYISEYSHSCTCTTICSNGNTATASTIHNHDGISSCVTTVVDCWGNYLTVTSTPDENGTNTVKVVYPDGNSEIFYGSYYHGIGDCTNP